MTWSSANAVLRKPTITIWPIFSSRVMMRSAASTEATTNRERNRKNIINEVVLTQLPAPPLKLLLAVIKNRQPDTIHVAAGSDDPVLAPRRDMQIIPCLQAQLLLRLQQFQFCLSLQQ